ncbi:MAG: transglutaminase family protein [Pseudomonadota bacterium]
MSIKVALTHKTSYRYDRAVRVDPQVIRLRPAPHCRAKVLSYSQTIEPGDHFLNWQQDPFGNYLARAVFPERVDHFQVTIDLVLEMIAVNPFDFFLEESVFHTPFSYDADDEADLKPYLVKAPIDGLTADLVREAHALWTAEGETRTIDFLVQLNQIIQSRVGYVVRMEPGVQTPEQTLTLAKGSCRDSAWLLVEVLRQLGLAARFVSGYLVQLVADEKPLEGPEGPTADFTDLHAWAEVYLPGAGWVGMDATSGLFAGEGHIPLAATPMPSSAAPITGALEPCEVTFDFDMQLKRLNDPPRAAKPMSDEQWAALDATGAAVDDKLKAGDVRLTVGGEPTFVSATDWDADEWTIAAVGPTKRQYADTFVRRLQQRFAPGGLLTHGQGKWYPGEPLPRWAFALLWRQDGVPLWQDPALLAVEDHTGTPDTQKFGATLAETLGLDANHAQPIYEDPAEFLLKEANLPVNLDPATNNLDNPIDRARLARVFDKGLSAPTGMVLPLQQAQSAALDRSVRWQSEIWETRRGQIFALPGDSPAGFRLPLGGLPHLAEGFYPHPGAPDPLQPLPPLPEVTIRRQSPTASVAPIATEAVPENPDIIGSVRTALVIEPRDGILYVFLPPVETTEAFVDLIAAVEATATALQTPVRIEGYGPPKDHRLNEIKVTPDPGVIEVNVHPAASWADQRDITTALYEEARASGLAAAGFQMDGRPCGSGGGAHVVLGGETPADSPFLRRPDVLASLVRLWQRHPSLSYLFSGQFIGPTSQAPRIDEARSDQLYEIELALGQLPGPDQSDFPPWLVDRVLRHLLVDVTGNTHRAEICIDKLYSPDGPTGRLGLVEFRAFEMPPHARMALAQTLLVRALVAWVWTSPVTDPLVDHGADLKDKYLLGDVLWDDFCNLLNRLSDGLKLSFDPEWFRAQFEFRFPLLGAFEAEGVHVELRSALEPWHVLGEEGTTGGTTRFVDSSLNRLQLKMTGARDDLVLTCNTHEVSLMRLGQSHVGGVRFRTWLPVSCLHPTIPATPKLTFDLVSPRQNRSLGGATYWATHPGGRAFETRPVNALEAQSRVESRFDAAGHTPGHVEITRTHGTGVTLDLRQVS